MKLFWNLTSLVPTGAPCPHLYSYDLVIFLYVFSWTLSHSGAKKYLSQDVIDSWVNCSIIEKVPLCEVSACTLNPLQIAVGTAVENGELIRKLRPVLHCKVNSLAKRQDTHLQRIGEAVTAWLSPKLSKQIALSFLFRFAISLGLYTKFTKGSRLMTERCIGKSRSKKKSEIFWRSNGTEFCTAHAWSSLAWPMPPIFVKNC